MPAQIRIASPDEADMALFNSEEDRSICARFTTERNIKIHDVPTVAALAWLHGCVRGDVPDNIRLDCSTGQYLNRICKRWPNISTYWRDVFRDVEKNNPFTASDVELANHPGCLMIHSQMVNISVDWLGEDGHSHIACLLRSPNGRIAGAIWLNRLYAQHMDDFDTHSVRFIALSASEGTTVEDDRGTTVPLISHTILDHTDHLSNSKTYGCPCSRPTTRTASPHHQLISSCPDYHKIYICFRFSNTNIISKVARSAPRR